MFSQRGPVKHYSLIIRVSYESFYGVVDHYPLFFYAGIHPSKKLASILWWWLSKFYTRVRPLKTTRYCLSNFFNPPNNLKTLLWKLKVDNGNCHPIKCHSFQPRLEFLNSRRIFCCLGILEQLQMSPARLALVGKGGGLHAYYWHWHWQGSNRWIGLLMVSLWWWRARLSVFMKFWGAALVGCLQTNDGRTSFDVFFKEVFSMIWSWL